MSFTLSPGVYVSSVDVSTTSATTTISYSYDNGYVWTPYIPMGSVTSSGTINFDGGSFIWVPQDHFAEHEDLFKI